MKSIGRRIYDALDSYEERMAISDLYGNHGEPDREDKFYNWLGKKKFLKIEGSNERTLHNLILEEDNLLELGTATYFDIKSSGGREDITIIMNWNF